MTGIDYIADERNRQIVQEGYTAAHDKDYPPNLLSNAAICYAMRFKDRRFNQYTKTPYLWPWDLQHWKPAVNQTKSQERIKELSKAGALIAAEIDNILRKG